MRAVGTCHRLLSRFGCPAPACLLCATPERNGSLTDAVSRTEQLRSLPSAVITSTAARLASCRHCRRCGAALHWTGLLGTLTHTCSTSTQLRHANQPVLLQVT